MPGRVRNGTRWRRVSDIEARFRRARGQEVIACEPAPAPPAPLLVAKLAELPAAPVAPKPAAPSDRFAVFKRTPGETVTVPPIVKVAVDDLTDEDLEKLTAPTKE